MYRLRIGEGDTTARKSKEIQGKTNAAARRAGRQQRRRQYLADAGVSDKKELEEVVVLASVHCVWGRVS